MKRVRDRLKELDGKLYESLLRSHDIAWNEWLPALSVQHDSYNSYPHIRNLEMYLDIIITSYEEIRKRDFFISAVEMYVILASILFHDIGKINTEVKEHSYESSRIICGKSVFDTIEVIKKNAEKPNYKVWASLGIPSFELALSIGRICEFHDIDKANEDEKTILRNNLSSIFIDAFGEVRQRSLAAMLTLVDHLDSAHTRILPDYLKGSGEIKVVGAFRRVITGVYIDLKTNMVTTALNERLPDGEAATVKYKPNLALSGNEIGIKDISESLLKLINVIHDIENQPDKKSDKLPYDILTEGKIDLNKKLNECLGKINTTRKAIDKWIDESIECLDKDKNENYSYLEDFFSITDKPKPTVTDKLIISGKLYADVEKNDANKVWPQNILQDLILENVMENNKALEIIKSELESLEIPINAWLIEHKEHLYNWHGAETYEPIFSRNYLEDTATKMWELSTQIFGLSYFTYENLAAMMREPNIQKVKMAVRRISILTSGNLKKIVSDTEKDNTQSAAMSVDSNQGTKKDNIQSAIMSGDSNWKWIVDNNDKPCCFMGLDKVKKIIDNAGEPYER